MVGRGDGRRPRRRIRSDLRRLQSGPFGPARGDPGPERSGRTCCLGAVVREIVAEADLVVGAVPGSMGFATARGRHRRGQGRRRHLVLPRRRPPRRGRPEPRG
ncbi:MAG: hypothetical protein M0C28_26955 [Candidatus Moduliflexus flocculans]|nr:hypothetical protein [Candidatus Moduliflexus flocculans]